MCHARADPTAQQVIERLSNLKLVAVIGVGITMPHA